MNINQGYKKIGNEHYNQLKYIYIRNNGGWDMWDMIEIEKYPCDDKREAETRERYCIEQNKSNLNSVIPTRSINEWHKDNKESRSLKCKEYNEKNREQITLKRKEYYEQNKEFVLLKCKEYTEKNKEKTAEYQKHYREKNKELLVLKSKEYFENKKAKILSKM